MPYSIKDFRDRGLYEEKTGRDECSFEGGKSRKINSLNLSSRIKRLLDNPTTKGDASRDDSAAITALINAGLNPADTYATFCATRRGYDARERKENHFDDYMQRTIEKSVAFVRENPAELNVNFASHRTMKPGDGIIVSMGHEIDIEKTNWIWEGYIPAGKLTVLAGDPGMGKSTLVGDIISRLSRGSFLPTGQRSIVGNAIIMSAEDSPEDTIIPRLIACDANIRKIGTIRDVKNDDGSSRYISFPQDLDLLKDAIISSGCRLLIIDPLTAFIEKGADSYKDQDMRRILHPIELIAQETGSAIVIIAHLNKKEDSSTLYRVGGSIGFIAAARSVLAVTRLPDERRVIYSLKSNLARRPMSIAYDIRQVTKERRRADEWRGESVIHSSAIRWLGEVDYDPFQPDRGAKDDGSSLDEAEDFLRQVLSEGQRQIPELISEAKKVGITKAYLLKAKTKMGLTSLRQNGEWAWSLPDE